MEAGKVLEKEKGETAGRATASCPASELKVAYFKDGIYSTIIKQLTPAEQLEIFRQLVSQIAKAAILKHDVEGEMRVIKGALVGKDDTYVYFVRATDGKVFQINHKNVRGIELNNFTGKEQEAVT
ncbi:MAG TPA: hypothetical protein ENI53_01300 [Thermoplasmatales archaeon]|nr:hypothetical protein [Thermoplasmatales archaeon]